MTVVFDRPPAAVTSKWQLAVQHDVAHLITMPHVTRQHIDRLIDDLASVPAAREQAIDEADHHRQRQSARCRGGDFRDARPRRGVNIETLSAEGVGDMAVTLLTVDKYDEALRALAKTPFQAISEDAIVVKLDDKPGELARIMRRFKDAQINLRSVRIIRRDQDKSIVAIATERTTEAMELVKDVMV